MQAVPIKGTVTLDGKPLADAGVVFISESPPAAFSGKTNEAGLYELQAIKGGNTAVQGLYKVTISRLVKPDGTPLGPDEAPMNAGAVEQIPAKYARGDLTTLSAEVGAGGGTFDFPLVSQ
ncbi:MAG TPA: carboxypeptidase-like regulatory domain-containing protein [Pirellulales bacterium]|nr:carboxypeptidase-like regulatory domain-containing protein [Pirellulales bacterium]